MKSLTGNRICKISDRNEEPPCGGRMEDRMPGQNMGGEFAKWKAELQMAVLSMKGTLPAGRMDLAAVSRFLKNEKQKQKQKQKGSDPETTEEPAPKQATAEEADAGRDGAKPAPQSGDSDSGAGREMSRPRQDRLKQAVVWSVVLDAPVCRRRRAQRKGGEVSKWKRTER